MPVALVTGASAGIGAAFARRLSADGYDVVLVARNAQRLEELAGELPGAAEVLPADLGEDAGVNTVADRLRAGDVDLLVNNAGFGTNGSLDEVDIAAEDAMLQVNVRAVLHLTHAALPAMLERGSGAILNISSMAGFTPGVGAATYSASKAYVTMLSRSLNATYAPRGVRVLAVCPGFTRTEFHDRLGGRPSMPEFMWLSAEQVVDAALADLAAGRDTSVAGRQYQALRLLSRYTPDAVVKPIAGIVRSRRGRD